MSHGHDMICQPVTLSGYAAWPKVADAMIEARISKWDKLTQLPVRGSSAILDAQGRVSEEAVEKPKEFSPIGRWRHWRVWRKRKFKKVAGHELIELGYESNGRW